MIARGSQLSNASALHRKVFGLLRDIYPSYTVLENEPIEVFVGGRKTVLFIDLFVKELRLCVECHGRQHFGFVPHFHGSRNGFSASVSRDQAKAQAVADAGCSYMTVNYDQEKTLTRRKLLRQILKAIQET